LNGKYKGFEIDFLRVLVGNPRAVIPCRYRDKGASGKIVPRIYWDLTFESRQVWKRLSTLPGFLW